MNLLSLPMLVAFIAATCQGHDLSDFSSTDSIASSEPTSTESSTVFLITIPPRYDVGNCTLTSTNVSFAGLRKILSRNPAFIYTKLNFIDLEFESDTAYLNSIPNAIDPLTWTWAAEGKGYLLRSFSPNFLYLSLGTLSPDVYHMELEISTGACGNFPNMTDTDKYFVVSKFLIDEFNNAYSNNSQIPVEFKICQEFYHEISNVKGTFKAFIVNLHVFIYLPDSIEIACWSTDYSYQLQDNESFFWLSLMYYTIFILGVLLSPIVIGLMIQRHPPKRDRGSYRYDRNTSLPIGLKYLALYWRDDISQYIPQSDASFNRIINFTRRALLLGLVFLFSYWEAILLRMLDDTYKTRLNSAFRFCVSLIAYYTLTSILTLLFLFYVAIMIRGVIMSGDLFLENDKQRKYFLGIELPEYLYVQESSEDQPWQNRFFEYMMNRWQMAINKRIIWDWLWNESKAGKLLTCEGPWGYISYVYKIPISFLFMIFLIVFYSPMAYTVIMFIIWIDDAEGVSVILTSIVAFPILLILCFPLLFGVIPLVAGIAALIADTVEYVFAGVLVNIVILDPIFFMVMAILSYTIMTINEFYDEYYQMNLILIKRARKSDEKLSKPPTSSRASISEDLFWYIVNDCKPIRIEFITSVIRLFVISFLAVIGFNVLEEVNSIDQLSDSATLIFSLIISFGVPIINNTIHSASSEQVRRQDLKRQINKALKRYRRDHPNLQYLTKEPEELEQRIEGRTTSAGEDGNIQGQTENQSVAMETISGRNGNI